MPSQAQFAGLPAPLGISLGRRAGQWLDGAAACLQPPRPFGNPQCEVRSVGQAHSPVAALGGMGGASVIRGERTVALCAHGLDRGRLTREDEPDVGLSELPKRCPTLMLIFD